MLRTIKRLSIPILAATSVLAIIFCFLFSIHYDPTENEIVTVYCVTQEAKSGNINEITQYSYDEKGRLLEIRKNDGKTVKNYSYDENGNPTLYPDSRGGNIAATYDANGNLLTYKYYFSDITNPNTNEEYIYDAKGRIIQTVCYSSDGTTHQNKAHTYDKYGNLIKTLIYQGEEIKGILNYIYDETGKHLINYQEHTVSNSKINLRRYIDYNQNGNEICNKSYEKGQLQQYKIYQYDSSGKMTTMEAMSISITNGKTETKEAYHYDSAGQLIKKEILSYHESISEEKPAGFMESAIDYEYDLFGNLIKETRTSGNDVTSIRQWTYDYRGNLVSCTLGSTLYKWYYDTHGNIVKMDFIYDGNIRNTTEYTYKSFKVTRKETEFIKTQQEGIFYLPIWDVNP